MPERRPERAADNRFVWVANLTGLLAIAISAILLLLPQPNHAQTGPSLDAPLKVAPNKFGKSPEEIAAAKAKWEAMKAKKEAARAAKAERQVKTRAERQAKKAAAEAVKSNNADDEESGRKKRCPPGERVDRVSRGGCI